MPLVKTHAVGNGDMTYIKHGSDSFTIIDCVISDDSKDAMLAEIRRESSDRGIVRFLSTHPDDDHFRGIHHLDDAMPIQNFYVVKNSATKENMSDSFRRYCRLRDGDKAFYISKGCTRKWLNDSDDARGSAGIHILWPDTSNETFKKALADANNGVAFNNISPVIRYSINGGASFIWLGDLETKFMEDIVNHVSLPQTTIVFAAHHGRDSGKIPHSWLDKLRPRIIIIGEAPSRHLNYYTGYNTLTQNTTGDITMDCDGSKVHFYVSNDTYEMRPWLLNEYKDGYGHYIGTQQV